MDSLGGGHAIDAGRYLKHAGRGGVGPQRARHMYPHLPAALPELRDGRLEISIFIGVPVEHAPLPAHRIEDLSAEVAAGLSRIVQTHSRGVVFELLPAQV